MTTATLRPLPCKSLTADGAVWFSALVSCVSGSGLLGHYFLLVLTHERPLGDCRLLWHLGWLSWRPTRPLVATGRQAFIQTVLPKRTVSDWGCVLAGQPTGCCAAL